MLITRRLFLLASCFPLLAACSSAGSPTNPPGATSVSQNQANPPGTQGAAAASTPTGAAKTPVATVSRPSAAASTPAVKTSATSTSTTNLKAGMYTIKKSELGGIWLLGYLTNTGSTPVARIDIVASLLDDAGKLLAKSDTVIDTRLVLPAGERSPFRAFFAQPPAKWAQERIQIQAEPYHPSSESFDPAVGLSVANTHTLPGPGFTIFGQVTNGGTGIAKPVEVLAIAYDAQEGVLDVDSIFTDPEEIAPGGTASFELSLTGVETEPAKYDLYVNGRIKS